MKKKIYMVVGSGTGIDIEFAKSIKEGKKIIEKWYRNNERSRNIITFKILPYSKNLVQHYMKEEYDIGKTAIILDEVI